MWKWKTLIAYLESEKNNISGQNARFIIRAYDIVIAELKNHSGSISQKQIDGLNITPHMKDKIKDIIQMPEFNPTLLDELCEVSGIGRKKALELIANGVKSIGDLKKKKFANQLPAEAITMLKFNPSRKIPHSHMLKLAPILTKFPEEVIMVGSFRREAPFSKDFDIMIVSDDKKILERYYNYLASKFGTIGIYLMGENKMSLIIEIPAELIGKRQSYKFDIFRSPRESKMAMLLYTTGSKQFNIRMRAKAKSMGYLLNQNGLYKGKKKLPIKSEQDFFIKLGINYLEPFER